MSAVATFTGSDRRRLLLAAAGLAAMPIARASTALNRLAFVSHAPDSDMWWNVIRNAINHASEDFDVHVDYLNPADGKIANMARIIDSIDPSRYAGVISTIADYDALAPSLLALGKRKLPLITVNSGTHAQSDALGALMHIGQPEFSAGKTAGEQLARRDVRSFICFNHYPNNPSSTERCEGFLAGLGAGASMTVVPLVGKPDSFAATVTAALNSHPNAQALLALGPLSAHPVLAALRGKAKPPLFATFDTSALIVEGVRQGLVEMAIDQQPYLQGYLSVALMSQAARRLPVPSSTALKVAVYASPALHARMSRYGLTLRSTPGRHVDSGPGMVTRVNVEKVERFSGQYR